MLQDLISDATCVLIGRLNIVTLNKLWSSCETNLDGLMRHKQVLGSPNPSLYIKIYKKIFQCSLNPTGTPAIWSWACVGGRDVRRVCLTFKVPRHIFSVSLWYAYMSQRWRGNLCAWADSHSETFRVNCSSPSLFSWGLPNMNWPLSFFPCSWKLSFLMHTHTHDTHVDENSCTHKSCLLNGSDGCKFLQFSFAPLCTQLSRFHCRHCLQCWWKTAF